MSMTIATAETVALPTQAAAHPYLVAAIEQIREAEGRLDYDALGLIRKREAGLLLIAVENGDRASYDLHDEIVRRASAAADRAFHQVRGTLQQDLLPALISL